jgi:GR25 family glycosyltransferase involved in LPS biosynthesis
METIPTYIINPKEHADRLQHIRHQFSDKPEFNVSIITPIEHTLGATSLWNTIKHIIQNEINDNYDFIIICEDDHQFTEAYSKEMLFDYIAKADKLNADILLAGTTWYMTALGVSKNLFLIDKFSGLIFFIIYSRFFKRILESEFSSSDVADYKISELANNKIVMYPFISTRKEFGHSAVIVKDSITGYPIESFEKAAAQIDILIKVKQFYQSLPNIAIDITEDQYRQMVIPVYIINLPERTERLIHIKKQFDEKKEFDTIIVEACKHKIGAVGLWNSIVKVINLAIENEDDVIIICEDDHQFTDNYSKEFLLKNILEAHNQGADVLSCGAGDFGQVVPITAERFWVNPLIGTQFIVVYKKLFKKILKYKFHNTNTADGVISELSSNIMLLCPFISIQKDFGYSDITKEHNEQQGLVSIMFNKTAKRLQNVKEAYIKIGA